mmetsp:Transcript_14194/g.34596  ORF Transcript_14194/g.34596 Transcript_14194/m.34596 type:complete len:270 (-) Transcript_14194:78-887(-)
MPSPSIFFLQPSSSSTTDTSDHRVSTTSKRASSASVGGKPAAFLSRCFFCTLTCACSPLFIRVTAFSSPELIDWSPTTKRRASSLRNSFPSIVRPTTLSSTSSPAFGVFQPSPFLTTFLRTPPSPEMSSTGSQEWRVSSYSTLSNSAPFGGAPMPESSAAYVGVTVRWHVSFFFIFASALLNASTIGVLPRLATSFSFDATVSPLSVIFQLNVTSSPSFGLCHFSPFWTTFFITPVSPVRSSPDIHRRTSTSKWSVASGGIFGGEPRAP